MSEKFTKGPWSAKNDNRNANPWRIFSSSNCIAQVNQAQKEAEANAKLIAAAPELYEALKMARDRLFSNYQADYLAARFNFNEAITMALDRVKHLDAAMKKATL